MFRGVQSRLVGMSLLLVLVAMVLAGSYLQNSLQNYYLDSVRENLEIQGQLLAGLVQGSLSVENRQGLQLSVQRFDTGGVSLAVLDANGVVLAASRDNANLLGQKLQTDEITHALGGSRGEATVRDERTRQRQLRLALPLQQGGQVAGVVYVSSSLERAYTTLSQFLRFLAYATALALAITAVLGFGLARTITDPIRELTKRAAEMAGGHFDQVIQVRSNDEIGRLGEMFNHLAKRLNETLQEIRSEKNKAEAILNYMADGLLALDPSGRVILVNPAAERLLETRRRSILGKTLHEFWPGVDLEADVQEAHRSGRTVLREILHPQAPRELVLQGFFTPLKGEKRQMMGTVMVLHDVTEQLRLEQMRRDLVANVSHELRTPLTTVKSYVETLLDGAVEKPDLRDRFLRVVSSETDRMVRLVRDLLQMSQLDQGTAAWEIAPCEVPQLVDDSLVKLAIPLQEKRLEVRRQFGTNLSQAEIDRDKVQQVMLNVLTNAIEFTPAGGHITIAVQNAGEFVRVSISDSGIGIPPADLPRIFERFYRVDKARSRSLGGTGLGLAIARQIVEALGGTIAIHSQLGEGTTVSFTLPVATRPAAVGR